MAELRWGAATDPGRIRPDNEDNLLAEPNVFAVADGMGGHRAGEVASLLAVDLLRARLSEPGADLETVVAAVAEVNGDIYRAAIGNPDQQGMGTTVTALAVIGAAPPADVGATTDPVTAATGDGAAVEPAGDADDTAAPEVAPALAEQLALVNVGDSRTYLLRHGRLRRVTVDHSYVQELVATGHITDDEARTHPRRNIVTRALGIDPAVRVDAWTLPLVRGDRYLLCSDGLVDEVRDEDIVAVLTTVTDPQAAADELVAAANRQGGRDNISVIVVDVVAGVEPPDPDAELDLEPVWEETAADEALAADDPEDEAATFDDLAAIVGGEDPRAVEAATAIATATTTTTTTVPISTAPTDAPTDADAPPKRRRRIVGFLAGLGVLAVLVLALVIAAAWARRSYFVAFDDTDTVVIYRGQKDGFLWFDPTVQNPTVLTKDELDEQSIERVDQEPVFSSREAAENFVNDQLETTTTTSTTTTTTTLPPTTTTVAPTTTTIAG